MSKHPHSLGIFFTTEMWERYGFYVVQTLLALYLALHLKWPDKQVYALVGSFTALTYITPVIGGWIADHLLGQIRCILLGTLCLFISYFILSLELTYPFFIGALAGIAVGTGLIKSNISSLLGNEYPEQSSHRERGFTIFYMGITLGIVLGTTFPSYLHARFGWSMPFTSAAIGAVFACAIFVKGVKQFRIEDYTPYQFNFSKSLLAAGILIVMWAMIYAILINPSFANFAFLCATLLSISYLAYSMFTEPQQQARKSAIIALLCVISVIFWAFYFQMFMSFTLFIVRIIQPTLHGLSMPPPYYVTLESISMLCIGFLMAHFSFQKNAHARHVGIRAGNKFLAALAMITLAYGVMIYVTQQSLQITTQLSPWYIIPVYVLIALAELLLSPVGLCTITQLASSKKVSTMMGIFFVSLGLGAFASGKLADITAIPQAETSLVAMKLSYLESFHTLFVILCSTMAITIGINYLINRLGNVHTIKS